jgi:hypothetical protein
MAEQKPNQSPWHHWERRRSSKSAPPVLVRFTAADEIVWTVWDTGFSKSRHHRLPHCDPDAKMRVFVNGAGVKRSYTFKRNEPRMLDPQTLERQLQGSEYLGKP